MTADFTLVTFNWLLVRLAAPVLAASLPLTTRIFRELALLSSTWLGTALLQATLLTLWGNWQGLYATTAFGQKLRTVAKAATGSALLLGLYCWLQGTPSWIAISAATLLHIASLVGWRWIAARRQSNQRPQDLRNVLIVGAGEVGQQVAAHVRNHPEAGRSLCGFLDDHRPLGDGVIGRVGNLARVARTGFVDEVILTIPHDRDRSLWVLQESRRLRLDVEMVLDLFGSAPSEVQLEQLGGLPVVCLHAERLPAMALTIKRYMDVTVASLAIAALAPLLALISILIAFDSKGAAVYSALRAGRKGKPFRCYKLRTMVDNADVLKDTLRSKNQRSGPCFKVAGDPRITRIGQFLRRYSLDELPQLWNVLKGDMSLVGPRPHPLDDFAAYEVDHLARLDVTPGLTGLWQVTARRDPSFQKGVELDREYIRRWSLGLDLQILFRTVLAVLNGSGD